MQLDLILHNAAIITMDPQRPSAQRIGILGGRIAGLDEELDGIGTKEEIDLGGRSVVPGFIDAHCHTSWYGLSLIDLSVAECTSLQQVYDAIEQAAAKLPDGQWLIASGFDHKQYGDNYPQLDLLDAACGQHPMFMTHNSGHLGVVNTVALKLAGVLEPGFTDPDGGSIVRDGSGQPTGVVQETAQTLFQDLFQPRSIADLEQAIAQATDVYASQGITSFTDAGIGGGWIGQSPVEFAAYQRLADSGRLKARAQLMPIMDVLHELDSHPDDGMGLGLDMGIASGFGSSMLSFGPVKVFLDGSLLGETAAVSEPYCNHHNPGNSGYFQADEQQLVNSIQRAYKSGWAIAAHAIGDRAIDLAIDTITDLQQRYGKRAVPNRIEHVSITREEHLPKLAAAQIAVTPQSSFFYAGGDGMAGSLGPDRMNWVYRATSFLEQGINVAGSSDRPVADGSVLRGMQAFVDRLTASGQIFGNPGERLDPLQALALYTREAAKATGSLDDKGTITTGKFADLAVLSGSPLEAAKLTDLNVDATLLGGQFTHNQL